MSDSEFLGLELRNARTEIERLRAQLEVWREDNEKQRARALAAEAALERLHNEVLRHRGCLGSPGECIRTIIRECLIPAPAAEPECAGPFADAMDCPKCRKDVLSCKFFVLALFHDVLFLLVSEMMKVALFIGYEGTVRFVVQLVGVLFCEGCGFVKQHCRCKPAAPAGKGE